MKKIILFFSLFALSVYSFSQQTEPPRSLTKQDYLRKSRHQKTFAWTLLVVGVSSVALSTTEFNFFGDAEKIKGHTAFLVLGLAEITTSIPLFIASSKNKKNAMSLSFKNEMMPQLLRNNFSYKAIPSVNIKFSL